MVDGIQSGSDGDVSDIIDPETKEHKKRERKIDLDDKEWYYKLRKKWFPRFVRFIAFIIVLNYSVVILNGLGWLNNSPWVLQSLTTESMIGILSVAGVMAVYLYPPGRGIFRKCKL